MPHSQVNLYSEQVGDRGIKATNRSQAVFGSQLLYASSWVRAWAAFHGGRTSRRSLLEFALYGTLVLGLCFSSSLFFSFSPCNFSSWHDRSCVLTGRHARFMEGWVGASDLWWVERIDETQDAIVTQKPLLVRGNYHRLGGCHEHTNNTKKW